MATMRCSGDTARETADVPFSTSGGDSKESPGFRNSVAHDDSQSSDQNEELRAQHDILQLARRHTAQSSGPQGSLFPTPSDASLDPSSPDFNARKWAKAFYRIRTDAADGGSLKTTGIAFKNLSVFGYGTSTDFQKTVGNAILDVVQVAKKMVGARQQRIDILHDVEGLLSSGEMLAVLGPPGSGCSTLLKTIAGDTHGFHVSDEATINYQGIHPRDLYSAFRGEAIYTAEIDDHFPHLTVGDTLYFAARARCPQTIPEGVSRRAYAEHLRDVTMAMFGILHTKDTRVGDDFVRGVSGGERKRVTIAEAALSYSPLQCWDNSTRGLDSANALEFCRTLRTQADVMGHTSCVAIYQASQDAYDVFDKVIVLYEGRQIFFGKTTEARAYFEALGFMCPEQQTTADFLTSMTSHQERLIRPGWEGKTPRSADDFARAWKASPQRAQLLGAIDAYQQEHPFRGAHQEAFAASRSSEKSASQRARSPFTLSYLEQVRLTLWRSWVLLLHDPSISMMLLMTNLFEGIVVSSLFFNLPPDASSMDRRALLLFFVVVINAFSSILEILTLYAKRRVVDKHARYALYHRSAEALSSMIMDLPYKVLNAVLLNLAVYFMTNLRREPGPFFFFLLVSFTMTLTMSMMFRLIASVTKSVSQALAPASIILLIIAMYAGFVVPPRYMLDWIGWVRWLNPVYYGLESVMLNEFVGLTFQCLDHIPSGPGYASVAPEARSCTVSGSKVGEEFVDGANYLSTVYGYTKSHRWRNFGVLIAYLILFLGLHLLAAEFIPSERSKGEVLVFSRKTLANRRGKGVSDDETGSVLGSQPRAIEDSGDAGGRMEKQTSVFHWKNVCYDVKVKGQDRRILDNVDGWVKPGTLTALMGASGAGKTTLLDVLATRVTMGVISGDMLVNGKPRDASFQRKTGYVQQQDLHLPTSTVREALNFSALLRQPARYSRKEKLDYVDTVIDLLGIGEYADAIVGVPGEGLNVEQRKRLTIGVELVARPELLLFLDEPTSGLDSQTSWSICNLMEKLTNSGQAVLCTIHQPSAMLFQRFDRLLLLARGGRTVYFGEIGRNSQTLVDYFVRNGAPPCLPGVNPAEYMLAAIGAAPGAHTEIDWPAVWRQTPEYQGVQDELARLASTSKTSASAENGTPALHTTFAAGYGVQFIEVTKRLFQQYWRSPSYIFSKGILTFGSALLIGLSFINANNTQRGLTSQMFGVFVFLLIFSQVVEQLMPLFVTQRTMYEARERPSRTYAWQAFLSANVVVEAAWNSLAAVLCFVCWYFPIGLYRNAYATDAVDSRGIAVFLQVWAFLMFTGTFGQMAIAALPNADIAGSVVNFFFIMMFTFTGILASPDEMPRFWIFMYRVNPFTYVVEGFLGSSLANASVRCSVDELVSFVAPAGQTCGRYMAEYIADHGGYLISPEAGDGDNCQYCPIGDTNAFLKKMSIDFGHRWRNFGLLWAYIIFNIAAAFFLYWLVRVPKTKKA